MQLSGRISQVPRNEEEEVGVSINEFAEDRYSLKSTNYLVLGYVSNQGYHREYRIPALGRKYGLFYGSRQH